MNDDALTAETWQAMVTALEKRLETEIAKQGPLYSERDVARAEVGAMRTALWNLILAYERYALYRDIHPTLQEGYLERMKAEAATGRALLTTLGERL
jgi:hypothetical protein